MNQGEFVAAAQRAGANHLSTTDLERFVNEAVFEFNAEELWPWRERVVTGAAPLTVSGLGPIAWVKDTERRPIYPRRRSELIEERRDLDAAGNAQCYYTGSDSGVVFTWPVSSSAITVCHHRTGGWLTGVESAASTTDTPIADVRWHDAILALVELRCRLADRDYEGAGKLWERYQARLEQAKQAELRDNWDEPDVIRVREVY